MKKNLIVIAIAAISLCACGEKKAKTVTGNEELDKKIEQTEKKLSEMTGIEKCEATWNKRYEGKVTLADVQPDFGFTEREEGMDCFEGNGVNLAKAVYLKKDGTDITPEEWNAYVTKIYKLTQKLAQDGKVVRGFGTNMDVKTREQALEELPLETLLAKGENLEWGFLKNDRFEACYLQLENLKNEKYVCLSLGEGIQKNMDEALKDAEKYLKN
ncbi:MAG: hypothetical protein IJ604_00380 [Prevotella sp.]|nr:hypothetical protein [Prevotella sp.]MBR1461826.1 hypothetical protein [Prevotella sp.]